MWSLAVSLSRTWQPDVFFVVVVFLLRYSTVPVQKTMNNVTEFIVFSASPHPNYKFHLPFSPSFELFVALHLQPRSVIGKLNSDLSHERSSILTSGLNCHSHFLTAWHVEYNQYRIIRNSYLCRFGGFSQQQSTGAASTQTLNSGTPKSS